VGLAHTLRNARALVGLTGKPVPVFAGADRPLLGAFKDEAAVHGAEGLGGVVLPDGPPAAPGIAADVIRAELRRTPGLTLIGIGPATNLALALATEPALLPHVEEIVLMTGAWGEGNFTPAAEFNAWNDPEALAVLLTCGRPVTLFTLDLTYQAKVTPQLIKSFRARPGGACWRASCDILGATPLSRRLGHAGFPLHDPCAIGWLLKPELYAARAMHVEMDLGPGPGRGRTLVDRWDRTRRPPNATVAEALDADGFFALLADRIAALP
jgi:purine nucleosidase